MENPQACEPIGLSIAEGRQPEKLRVKGAHHGLSGRTVHFLCSIPLGLAIGELVTQEQLTGERRLSDALTACDGGWDALPLAQKKLSRLFPELWETTKAAERWLARNPLIPHINIIRF